MADHSFSERRACRLIGVNRSAWQYEPLRGKDDAVRERMREIANERRRFGYRRLAILLKREGKGMNLKKVYRLYREERLTVRKRGGRKRALGTRAPMAIPQEPNQRWSLDFLSDLLACGRRFRMLNVIDDYSRECLGCVVDTSLSGRRVVRELSAIAERRGLPCMVVSDNPVLGSLPSTIRENPSPPRCRASSTNHLARPTPATSSRAEGAEPIRQRVHAADGSQKGSWSRPRRRRSNNTGMSASAATSCRRRVATIDTLLASAMIADGVPSRTASSITASNAASS